MRSRKTKRRGHVLGEIPVMASCLVASVAMLFEWGLSEWVPLTVGSAAILCAVWFCVFRRQS
jgi:hypothetical protein